ncbi:hypothetical protein BKA62DRAFT_687588 [Auriculariales sp. MPI-PUGE-AT-0066]|nr:hypothetical protein BKA62DRAFT_687588 [Auriculariales sp. MPI-PUGE-AT-0066]
MPVKDLELPAALKKRDYPIDASELATRLREIDFSSSQQESSIRKIITRKVQTTPLGQHVLAMRKSNQPLYKHTVSIAPNITLEIPSNEQCTVIPTFEPFAIWLSVGNELFPGGANLERAEWLRRHILLREYITEELAEYQDVLDSSRIRFDEAIPNTILANYLRHMQASSAVRSDGSYVFATPPTTDYPLGKIKWMPPTDTSVDEESWCAGIELFPQPAMFCVPTQYWRDPTRRYPLLQVAVFKVFCAIFDFLPDIKRVYDNRRAKLLSDREATAAAATLAADSSAKMYEIVMQMQRRLAVESPHLAVTQWPNALLNSPPCTISPPPNAVSENLMQRFYKLQSIGMPFVGSIEPLLNCRYSPSLKAPEYIITVEDWRTSGVMPRYKIQCVDVHQQTVRPPYLVPMGSTCLFELYEFVEDHRDELVREVSFREKQTLRSGEMRDTEKMRGRGHPGMVYVAKNLTETRTNMVTTFGRHTLTSQLNVQETAALDPADLKYINTRTSAKEPNSVSVTVYMLRVKTGLPHLVVTDIKNRVIVIRSIRIFERLMLHYSAMINHNDVSMPTVDSLPDLGDAYTPHVSAPSSP